MLKKLLSLASLLSFLSLAPPLRAANPTLAGPNTFTGSNTFIGTNTVRGSLTITNDTATSTASNHVAFRPNTTNLINAMMNLAPNTTSNALTLTNSNPATVNNQSWSPAIHFGASGWKTFATAGPQAVDFQEFVVPVQGGLNPTVSYVWQVSVNGAAYTPFVTWQAAGLGTTFNFPLNVISSLSVYGSGINLKTNTSITWTNGGVTLTSGSDLVTGSSIKFLGVNKPSAAAVFDVNGGILSSNLISSNGISSKAQNGTALSAITTGASPWTYTWDSAFNGYIFFNSTVAVTSITYNGTTLPALTIASGQLPMATNAVIVITYTGVLTANKLLF